MLGLHVPIVAAAVRGKLSAGERPDRGVGNVLVAISFLHGLAVEELRRTELDYRDPSYEVLLTARAVKPGAMP